MKTTFSRLDKPYMSGYIATRSDGISVEVVHTDSCCGLWHLFLTSGESVIACSVDYFRKFGHNDTSKENAMAVAKTLVC